MSEETQTVTDAQTVVNEPQVQPKTQAEPQAEPTDVLTKVNQTADPQVEPPKPEDFTFNYNDIEKIQDPQAKEQALKAYKSFERGFNKKFQEVGLTAIPGEISINFIF